ncbi:M28 family peptidase [Pseudobythopirellula maris]|nr:M28 family peptidase [Pseudobythopirellula maris]
MPLSQPKSDDAGELVERILDACPRRLPGSRDEQRALRMLYNAFSENGHTPADWRVEWPRFRANRSIYPVLALHLGVALVGTLLLPVAPYAAAALHALAAISYLGDTTYRFYLLRRLLPRRLTQSLMVTRPSKSPQPRRRIVLIGHADASHTGLLFHPKLTRGSTGAAPPWPFGFVRRPMQIFVGVCAALVALDVIYGLTGAHLNLFIGATGLAFLYGTLMNLEILWRDKVSPGASDNMSGSVAAPILARRLAADLPDDVELVCVVTSAEEPGSLGSAALQREMRERWSRQNTYVLALDCLTNGELCYKSQSEVVPLKASPPLVAAVQAAADKLGRPPLRCWDAPAGMDDSTPFRMRGYESLCLAAVDPRLGVSRHYHQMTDDAANLEREELSRSIDFAEEVVKQLVDAPADAIPTSEPTDFTPPRSRDLPNPWRSAVFACSVGAGAGAWCGFVSPLGFAESFVWLRMAWIGFLALLCVWWFLQRLGVDPNRYDIGRSASLLALGGLLSAAAGVLAHPIRLHSLAPPLLLISAGALGGFLLHRLALQLHRKRNRQNAID